MAYQTAYGVPLGARVGLMLIFPNCSGQKCPIQKKLLIRLEKCLVVPPAAQNWTSRSMITARRILMDAQSVDHCLQVTLLQVQCSADSRPIVEFDWPVQNWRQRHWWQRTVYRPRADWSQKLVRQERFVHRHSSWQVLVLLPSAVSQLGQECIWGPVLFVTTYQCEQSFSVMIVVKNEQRNRLEAIFPHDMRLVLWNVWITELAASKQALCPTKSKNSKKTISWMCVTESKKEIKGPGRLKLEGYGALLETDDSGTLRNAGLSSTHCSCTVT